MGPKEQDIDDFLVFQFATHVPCSELKSSDLETPTGTNQKQSSNKSVLCTLSVEVGGEFELSPSPDSSEAAIPSPNRVMSEKD